MYRVLPFVLFMAFIGAAELLRLLADLGWLDLSETALYYLYPVKALSVAALLYAFRAQYKEVRLRDLGDGKVTAAVCLTGFVTFTLWISIDLTVSVARPPAGFAPVLLPEGPIRLLMTAIRLAGAVLVVPVMEELFWRSFLLRYLIGSDFKSVQVGTFTWTSFLISTVLFGLEHHLVLAGMVAGAIYNVVCYKTRSIAQCILAHAVTNLALGCYVLYTGKWYFW